jgi:hypothetical protein
VSGIHGVEPYYYCLLGFSLSSLVRSICRIHTLLPM